MYLVQAVRVHGKGNFRRVFATVPSTQEAMEQASVAADTCGDYATVVQIVRRPNYEVQPKCFGTVVTFPVSPRAEETSRAST
jgi:hypothetical protein